MVRAERGRCAGRQSAGDVQVLDAAKLLVDVVCGQRVRLLDGLHLRFPGIGILFGVNLRYVHI